MSTRIIIEKDGERYEANDLTARFTDEKRLLCVENELDNDAVYSRFAIFPPVVRTDNSEVIARLERGIERRDAQIRVLQAENAKLREALKDVLTVAKNRIPTIPTYFECEAIGKANDIINGISKKGGAE